MTPERHKRIERVWQELARWIPDDVRDKFESYAHLLHSAYSIAEAESRIAEYTRGFAEGATSAHEFVGESKALRFDADDKQRIDPQTPAKLMLH